MNRRCLCIVVIAFCLLLAAPPVVEAQQAGKIPRLGWLINNTPTGSRDDQLFRQALLNQLHELNAGDGFSRFKRGAPCLICGEPDAIFAYFWIGGGVAYLHAACDAIWKHERKRQEGT